MSLDEVYRQLRQLPCCKVMLDIKVHALLHKIYEPPKIPPVEMVVVLLKRHHDRACACYDPSQIAVDHILDL